MQQPRKPPCPLLLQTVVSAVLPEMQPLRFHRKRRKTLVSPSQESQEFGEGNVEGEEKPLHSQCHPVPFFLILSKLVPGGTGGDRENASFGVDVASCINCRCLFFLFCFLHRTASLQEQGIEGPAQSSGHGS